jgi:AraC family transcriptional regulator
MRVNEEKILRKSEQYFNTPTNLASKLFFYVKVVGHIFYQEGYKLDTRSHDSYLALFLNKGRMEFNFPARKVSLSQNEMILFDYRLPHSYFAVEDSEAIWIQFDGGELTAFSSFCVQRKVPLCQSFEMVIRRSTI